MITAHFPSGYVFYRLLGVEWRAAALVFPAALLGATLPDLDLIWFYFIDERAFHHHRYWVHIPAIWAIVALITLPLVRWRAPQFFAAAITFFLALLVHICLDSVAGDVLWLWPWSNEMFAFFTVPPTHESWVLSFLTYWTVGLEVSVWLAALFLYRSRP